MSSAEWWRGAVIYQIYPRSFLDTNNDGVGDLPGITQKLEEIADLGVDGIWISPFFRSPMKDFGYDVSDYRDVDPLFGTLADFDILLEKAHSLGLKIIIDLVLSHTSDQHPWFSDPDKKDWYVWVDAKEDDSEPNNWMSVFGGPAWEWSEKHQQYYLHNFLKEQPDLNLHNPEVQNEVFDICRFWLDRGVDGFRLDVANFYFHDQQLRDNPPKTHGAKFATQLEKDTPYSQQQHIYDKSRPENLEFLKQLRALTDEYQDKVLIGEIGDDHPFERSREYTAGDQYLHTCYNTHLMSGVHKELTELSIRTPVEEFFELLDNKESDKISKSCDSWPSWAFSNHDVVRVSSRWFKPFDHDPKFSKMLIALLGCLPGTLFLYQGEELGLPEAKIPFDQLQDPWAKETWPEWQGRDGCRTPMVWSDSQYCGFSNSLPWLPIPETHQDLHYEKQKQDQNSVLNFTKKFLKWRSENVSIFQSDFTFNDTKHSKIIHISYKEKEGDTHCIFNLSFDEIAYKKHVLKPCDFIIDGFSDL